MVVERPPNMRKRSSTFRYGGFANLADRSSMVRYVGGGGDIARYAGGGEDLDEDRDEDLDEDLDDGKDRLCTCFLASLA